MHIRRNEGEPRKMQRESWDEWGLRTCCETKQFRGPTSAKIPICVVDKVRSQESSAF